MTPVQTLVECAPTQAFLSTPAAASENYDIESEDNFEPEEPVEEELVGAYSRHVAEGMAPDVIAHFTFEATEHRADIQEGVTKLRVPMLGLILTVKKCRTRTYEGVVDGCTLELMT